MWTEEQIQTWEKIKKAVRKVKQIERERKSDPQHEAYIFDVIERTALAIRDELRLW